MGRYYAFMKTTSSRVETLATVAVSLVGILGAFWLAWWYYGFAISPWWYGTIRHQYTPVAGVVASRDIRYTPKDRYGVGGFFSGHVEILINGTLRTLVVYDSYTERSPVEHVLDTSYPVGQTVTVLSHPHGRDIIADYGDTAVENWLKVTVGMLFFLIVFVPLLYVAGAALRSLFPESKKDY